MPSFKVMSMVAMLLIIIMFSGCGDDEQEKEIPISMPQSSIKPLQPLPEKFDVDVYWDTTISMQGFTRLATGNVYRHLPDTLGDIVNSLNTDGTDSVKVQFYRFGDSIVPVEGRDHLELRKPEVYTDLVTSFSSVIDVVNPEHLSIVVTDLFESNADWSNVTQKCREKIFSKNLSIAIIGIKNSFSGEIFDVGLDAASFSYDSGDDESKFRPFYIFLMGSESQIRAFIEEWNRNKSDLPANDMHHIVLSKYISSRIENLRVANAKASDKKNFLSDRRILGTEKLTQEAKELLQEIVIVDSSDEVSVKVPVNYQPYSDTCILSQGFEMQVKIFTWEKTEWKEHEVKGVNKKFVTNGELELSFWPEKTLPKGRIVLVQVQIVPPKDGLILPEWISDWDMGNIDGSPDQFDATKTVNLKRIANSLKNTLFSTVKPTIAELDLVIDER